jgi:HIV-1 Vpr-binding protein
LCGGAGDETTYQVHDSYVYHVEPSRDSRLLITSSSWRSPFSKLWSMGEFFEEKFEFKDEEYLEFSKLKQVSYSLSSPQGADPTTLLSA